jgi:hypothetical protein
MTVFINALALVGLSGLVVTVLGAVGLSAVMVALLAIGMVDGPLGGRLERIFGSSAAMEEQHGQAQVRKAA